jgi:hypothetical protein
MVDSMNSTAETATIGGTENRRLLLLAPSLGFGGGIERMAESIAANWPGPVARIDLYHPKEVAVPTGNLRAKSRFIRRALTTGARQRPAVVLALHVNFLPVALLLGALMRARVAMFGIGVEVWERFPWWTRLLIRRCGHVLAISSFTAFWMARRAGISINRIRVVPLPVDRRFADEPPTKRRHDEALAAEDTAHGYSISARASLQRVLRSS